MVPQPPINMIRKAMRTHERWRFIPMPMELKDQAKLADVEGFSRTLQSLLTGGNGDSGVAKTAHCEPAGFSTEYARLVIDSLKEGSFLATSAIRSQVRAKASKRIDLEVPSLVEPLDPFFANCSNYRLLWARRWKSQGEHISLKEGRVCLSSLRRSSRVVSLQGMRKLTISDNLPIVCAFEKGRSSNHRVNRLCRQAAALQFSSGIQWAIRHIETKRNPSDQPSRKFERRNMRVPMSAFGVVVNEGSGLSTEASAPSKPLKPFRPHAHSFFPHGGGKVFLEVFSGTGRLTHAVDEKHIPVLEPIDYANGAHCDLRRRSTQEVILKWLERGVIGFLHIGTPCTIWSQARRNVSNSTKAFCKERDGLELALFSAQLIRVCNKFGVPYAIENPRTSKLFQFEPLVAAIGTGQNFNVDFDMCQYGECYKKPTRIVTSAKWLAALSNKCCHKSHEVWLKGKARVRGPTGRAVYVNRTALAGAYPVRFVLKYAGLIQQFAQLGSQDEQSVQISWRAALRSAENRKAEKCKPAKATLCAWGPDQQNELHLLSQAGGVERFFDAIALGRDPKKAWEVLRGESV